MQLKLSILTKLDKKEFKIKNNFISLKIYK